MSNLCIPMGDSCPCQKICWKHQS